MRRALSALVAVVASALCFGAQAASPPQVGPCDDDPKDRALHSAGSLVTVEYRGYSASRTKYGFDTFQTTSPPKKYLLMTTTDAGQEVDYYTGNCGYLGPMTCYSGSVRFDVTASWTNATSVIGTYKSCDAYGSCTNLGSHTFGPLPTGSGSDSATFSFGKGFKPSYDITGAGSCSGVVHFTPDAIAGYREERYSTTCGGSTITDYNGGPQLLDVQSQWPVVDSTTVKHATNSASYTPGIRTWTLSEEYTTTALEQNAWSDLYACSAPNWSRVASFNACTTNCGDSSLSDAWAYRQLTSNETNIALRRLEFRFRVQTQRETHYVLHWLERITYAAGSAPSEVLRKIPIEGTGAEVISEVYSLAPPGVNGTNSLVAYWIEPFDSCAGSGTAAMNGVRWSVDLGEAAFGKPAGQLWLQPETPSPALATPEWRLD